MRLEAASPRCFFTVLCIVIIRESNRYVLHVYVCSSYNNFNDSNPKFKCILHSNPSHDESAPLHRRYYEISDALQFIVLLKSG